MQSFACFGSYTSASVFAFWFIVELEEIYTLSPGLIIVEHVCLFVLLLWSSQYSSIHSRVTNEGHKAPWSHRLLGHRHVEPNK